MVLRRFGLSPRRMESLLNRYVQTTTDLDCRPTFPVTAVTLMRNPGIIGKLSEKGAEVAIHGYIHMDHKGLSLRQQEEHFQKAMSAFQACGIPFNGFRGPYLRSNEATLEALGKLDFSYDSTEVVWWDVLKPSEHAPRKWDNYQRLLQFYEARSADTELSLPRLCNGLAVIPVSLPDDESLVGRLGIRDAARIAEVWESILEATYSLGELFTMQLHHERVPHCETALRRVLEQASRKSPPVWKATLAEIADWWKKRDGFSFRIEPKGDGTWGISAACSEDATILAKNCAVEGAAEEWTSGYTIVRSPDFTVRSQIRPAVGVAPDTPPNAIELLRSEGYLVETSSDRQSYSIFFDSLANFDRSRERSIVDAIEKSEAPLVRYWRWPNGAHSALAVTGDVDSLTLIDFFMRIVEVWQQRLSRNHR